MTPLPSPKILRGSPSSKITSWIESSRKQAIALLSGKDRRLAIIVGPCSIHNYDSAIEYGERLKKVQKQIGMHCFLIMRVFCEKPRTMGGWKGFLYDPYLNGSNDLAQGLHLTRKLLTELALREIPVATEFVDPLLALYISDLVTWGFIGARTSTSPTHRSLASNLPFPIGFKNCLDGSIDLPIHSMVVAKDPHVYFGINEEGFISQQLSPGNPNTALVLRGSLKEVNYEPEAVASAIAKLEEWHLPKRLIIDCAHGNCQKQHSKQIEVFRKVLEMRNNEIIGLMVESHLKAGSQVQQPYSPDVSITDPCIDWETTESLIEEAAALSSISSPWSI